MNTGEIPRRKFTMTSERNDPSEDKKEKKQNKLLIIIIILLLIALLFCGAFIGVFVFGGVGGGGGGVVIDPNLGDLENETQKEKPAKKPNVSIPGWTKLTIPADTVTITDIPFYNPEKNEGLYYLTFEIRLLDAKGEVSEVLFTSGAVPPGKQLQSITLNRALPAGTYNTILHIQPYYIEDNTPTNNVDTKMTLIVE